MSVKSKLRSALSRRKHWSDPKGGKNVAKMVRARAARTGGRSFRNSSSHRSGGLEFFARRQGYRDTTTGAVPGPNDAQENATYEWGNDPSFSELEKMLLVNPVAWRVIYVVAIDALLNHPKILRKDREKVPRRNIDLQFARLSEEFFGLLERTNFWRILKLSLITERTYGTAAMILYASDAKDLEDLEEPLDRNSSVVRFGVIAEGDMTPVEYDDEGRIVTWRVTRKTERNVTIPVIVHNSRLLILRQREITTEGWKGTTILRNVWEVLLALLEVVRGAGEAFFRWGTGKPVFWVDVNSDEELDAFMDSLGDPTRNEWMAFRNDLVTKMEMKGLENATALNPDKFLPQLLKLISVSTGISQPILEGAQAGRVTAAEVNERDYFVTLSLIQAYVSEVIFEPLIRYFVPELEGRYDWEVVWPLRYRRSAEDEANLAKVQIDTLAVKSQFMTANEVRKELGMKKLEPHNYIVDPFDPAFQPGEALFGPSAAILSQLRPEQLALPSPNTPATQPSSEE